MLAGTSFCVCNVALHQYLLIWKQLIKQRESILTKTMEDAVLD